MGKQVDGQIDGWWTDGWMVRHVDEKTDGQMYEQMNRQTDGQVSKWIYGWKDEWMDRWTEGWTEGWAGGRMEGQTERRNLESLVSGSSTVTLGFCWGSGSHRAAGRESQPNTSVPDFSVRVEKIEELRQTGEEGLSRQPSLLPSSPEAEMPLRTM